MRIDTLTIGQRLALGFGLVLVLILALTGIGIHRVLRIDDGLSTINQVNSVKQRYAINFRGSVHDRAIALRDVVLSEDPAVVEEANAMIDRLTEDYAQSAAPLEAMVADPATGDAEEAAMLAAIQEVESRTLPLIERTRALREAGALAEARALVLGEAAPAFTTWLARINALIDLEEAKNAREAEAAAATANGFAALMLVLSVLALVIGAGVAWLITRSVIVPLRQALDVAERVGAGDLGSEIHVTGRDETGQLLAAMGRMQQQLVAFSQGQREIAERHEAGEISFRMDAAAYPGVYGTMATDINELVAAHIAVKMRMAELVARYAIGDFTEDMPRLPGEKARLTVIMDTAKGNLTLISGEIKRLSAAAAAGDFSARGDAGRFEFGFRAMVDDLNRLMSTADANLAQISTVFDAFARGDLTARMTGDHPGVFGRIRDDATGTGQRLTEIVRGIQSAVASIHLAASEIASGNADLSRRTEQQAASLEETSALMDELTSKVRRNAEHAGQANALVRDAGEAAAAGGRVVEEVVATMGAISESSRRIADIIGVIDGIAFQTNILALNAAVEAARAGVQGRGIAVVSAEVRSLAQRSAGAAKDIKSLISGSVENVEAGADRVARAGEAMGQIVGAVREVTDIMAGITTASSEQRSDIEQVGQTVVQLDHVTQQNAALVEEASAAARGLQDQASGLADAVAVFKVAATPRPLRSAA